jgi:hypothetical protein
MKLSVVSIVVAQRRESCNKVTRIIGDSCDLRLPTLTTPSAIVAF